MKTKILSICTSLILFISISLSAQTSNYLWAKSAGEVDNDVANGVSADRNGNIFVAGYYESTKIAFGTDTLTNTGPSGNADIYLVKYDPSGNVLWAKTIGGTDYDYGWSTAADTAGNVFVTGYFNSSTIVFGTDTLTNSGHGDIFLAKYDPSGNVLWAKSAGGINDDIAYSVSTDQSGNALLTGVFQSSSLTFGTTTLNNAGSSDIFVAKYSASGNVLWAKSTGGTNDDEAWGVATDASGNVFVTGYFSSSSITLGSITLTNTGSAGSSYDFFIAKYDVNGNASWAKKAGGAASSDYGQSVATDPSGNVLVTGYFNSPTITFGTTTLTNAGSDDIFLVKYDASGNVSWAKSAGGNSFDNGQSVTTDALGNVFLTGVFGSSNITFGTTTFYNAGNSDMFIAKYNASGNVIWAKSAGGLASESGQGITTDPSGNVIVAGWFQSATINFGTHSLTNSDNTTFTSDIFVVKMDDITGIEKNSLAENALMGVYPNPSTGIFSVKYISSVSLGTAYIYVMNMLGEKVYAAKVIDPADIKMDLSDQANGIYFVRIASEKGSITKKISISK